MKPSRSSTGRCKTLSIGGATYDLFVRTGTGILREDGEKILALPLGAKVRVEQVIETCGGGAANTSVGLARLGCAAHFEGILGSDQWGQRLLENFTKEGVNPDCATIVEGETSSFSIILSAGSGERVILYDPGTNAHLHDANFDRDHAACMDWIYLNHIHERSDMIENDLIDILKKNPDIGLTWNPGGAHIHTGMHDADVICLLAQTDLLLLNKEEALSFTGASSIEAALDALLHAGVNTVCISDGARGSIGANAQSRYRCPTIADAKIIDTTGAGDAFGSGATWALLQGFDLPTTLKAGTINATSVIGAIGAEAGLLTDTDMQNRLRSVHLGVSALPS